MEWDRQIEMAIGQGSNDGVISLKREEEFCFFVNQVLFFKRGKNKTKSKRKKEKFGYRVVLRHFY